ncbi:hypothetical protein DDT52_10280 [Brenneria roseae subsp. roseae]|uniref:hypothetical protein n=1 Tax=Brenneria roseae TaxID=1509241 RepID=UPI000D61B5F0|nr:hypothetical protein [Brenneria roseae]PWC20242.1 hypothetical protein DDT52_10280 [Brenneria roseae subsp. roseae]
MGADCAIKNRPKRFSTSLATARQGRVKIAGHKENTLSAYRLQGGVTIMTITSTADGDISG